MEPNIDSTHLKDETIVKAEAAESSATMTAGPTDPGPIDEIVIKVEEDTGSRGFGPIEPTAVTDPVTKPTWKEYIARQEARRAARLAAIPPKSINGIPESSGSNDAAFSATIDTLSGTDDAALTKTADTPPAIDNTLSFDFLDQLRDASREVGQAQVAPMLPQQDNIISTYAEKQNPSDSQPVELQAEGSDIAVTSIPITSTLNDDESLFLPPKEEEEEDEGIMTDLAIRSVPTAIPSEQPGSEPSTSSIQIKPEEEADIKLSEVPAMLTTFPSAESLGLEEQSLPKTAAEVRTHTFDAGIGKGVLIRTILSKYTIKLRSGSLSSTQKQVVYNILKTTYKLEDIVDFSETATKTALNVITGEEKSIRFAYRFPDPFPAIAAFVMDHVQAEFGFKEIVEEPNIPSLPSTTTAVTGQKRKRSETKTLHTTERKVIDLNDPKVKDIMPNIIFTEVNRKGFRLANKALRITSNKFGHNGLTIGSWFAYRINALQVGAHGSSQGGIYSDHYGAYSIVIGGGYTGLDKDEGDHIVFTGAGSDTNKDPSNPHISQTTKGLELSEKNKHPIRVLRSFKGNRDYAPSIGYRYDGLYIIVDKQTLTNKLGGKYIQFELERKTDQEPIDFSRPNKGERKAYKFLMESQ